MVLSMREEGAVVGVGTLVDVLNLETAFLEEPILNSGNNLMHVHLVVNIEVEEVVRSYNIKIVEQTNRTCHVSSATYCAVVLATKKFTMHIEWF